MLHCQMCLTCYTTVQINNCLKRTSYNQSSHYKNYRRLNFMNGSHHKPTTKSTRFAVSKDEKEGTGKSMKNALHVQQYGKRHLSV